MAHRTMYSIIRRIRTVNGMDTSPTPPPRNVCRVRNADTQGARCPSPPAISLRFRPRLGHMCAGSADIKSTQLASVPSAAAASPARAHVISDNARGRPGDRDRLADHAAVLTSVHTDRLRLPRRKRTAAVDVGRRESGAGDSCHLTRVSDDELSRPLRQPSAGAGASA